MVLIYYSIEWWKSILVIVSKSLFQMTISIKLKCAKNDNKCIWHKYTYIHTVHGACHGMQNVFCVWSNGAMGVFNVHCSMFIFYMNAKIIGRNITDELWQWILCSVLHHLVFECWMHSIDGDDFVLEILTNQNSSENKRIACTECFKTMAPGCGVHTMHWYDQT